MELTKKQEEGLKIAIARYRAHEKYTVIAGYAGTGKSTLVRFIIEALNVPEDRICYATFTGKAAEVLRKKGNKNACTLHKLLYESYPKRDGGFWHRPRISISYSIVVVDEVSMAPKELMTLLFSHHCHVICLGDPFQLPPINKNDDNHLLDNPHIFLDEVMRQAQDSAIIRLTMAIRNNELIANITGEEIKILPQKELNTGMLTWADQILVATNEKRINLNNQIRTLLQRGDAPEDGDKVVCLRNYWDVCDNEGSPLVNGTIGILNDSFATSRHVPRENLQFSVTMGDFLTDTGVYSSLEMDTQMILTGEKCCDWKTAYRLEKKMAGIVPLEFTYGYAITCHKAQGSEWGKVLVIEEKFPFKAEEHARWLYTACTRASEKLVLVTKE